MPSRRQFESRPQRTVRSFTREFLENLRYHRGVEIYATPDDYYQALALTVREYMMQDWLDSLHSQNRTGPKIVCYLSLVTTAQVLADRYADDARRAGEYDFHRMFL